MRYLSILLLFSQVAYAGNFSGYWRFDDSCKNSDEPELTHSVITLNKTNSPKYVGTWAGSTNLRGSGLGGKLRGYEKKSKLYLSSCIVPEEGDMSEAYKNSGICPHYKFIGVFTVNDEELIRTSLPIFGPFAESYLKAMKPESIADFASQSRLYECE